MVNPEGGSPVNHIFGGLIAGKGRHGFDGGIVMPVTARALLPVAALALTSSASTAAPEAF
jgi:hypothetical protein